MTEYIILGSAAVAPVLLALVLRVHATYVFVAIVSGWLLSQSLGTTIGLVLSMSVKGGNPDLWAKVGLLVLPLVITLLLLSKSMKRGFLFQIIPLVTSGLLFTVLLLELIPQPLQANIYLSPIGSQLRLSGDIIIGVSVLLNLLSMWFLFRNKGYKEDGGKHHK